MHLLRRLALANRPFACAIILLALMLKIAVPAGYMPAMVDGHMALSGCFGMEQQAAPTMDKHHEHGEKHGSKEQGAVYQPCAFTGLSAPFLASADPVLIAAAILFALVLGAAPLQVLAASAPPFLRPPLRGPPII